MTINDMPDQVTYAGWKELADGSLIKVTSERESPEAAALEIRAYGLREGIAAQGIPFYIVREVLSFAPLSKTVFSITTTTTPVVRDAG